MNEFTPVKPYRTEMAASTFRWGNIAKDLPNNLPERRNSLQRSHFRAQIIETRVVS